MDRFEPEAAHQPALWETVATSLRRAIILGELGPDVHLEEPALAGKFGVSRIPVREALTRLEQEGLVRLERRRGAFVVGVNERDIADIYECRRVIEVHAIRRAAERIDPASVEDLAALVLEMERALADDQPQRVGQPDMEFHRQIVVQSGNRRLLAAWVPMAGLVASILGITNTTVADLPASVHSHRHLIAALADRDADRAARLLHEHLIGGEGVLRQALRQVSGRAPVLAAARDGSLAARARAV